MIIKTRKGDIAINMVAVLVITVISITMLLALFSLRVPGFSKSIYCKTFFFIHSSTFIPRGIRADQAYCRETKLLEPPIVLGAEAPINISITGYMYACWKEMDYGDYDKNKLCYELKVGPKAGPLSAVTKEEVTKVLVEEDLCRLFSSNSMTVVIDGKSHVCGDSDDIDWQLPPGDFTVDQSILIEYLDGKIMVS